VIAVALGCGIVFDHLWPARLEALLLAGVTLSIAWLALARFGFARVSAAILLLCVGCLGAARHHLGWSAASDNDLSLYASDEPRLVRVTGTLLERPDVISREAGNKRSAWPHPDASSATLSVECLSEGGDEIPVTGRALVHVNGHLVHCDVGDQVEVFGWLNSFSPAKNPGGFDPAAFYRRQGLRCMLRADHPDAVRLLRAGSPLSIWRCAARLRAEGEAPFTRDLSARTGPVASALLFGGRMQMDEEIRDAFTQSGLLHVLAISGMHVAILGLLLWGVGRLAGLSVRGTSALTIVGVLGYTILTDCNPPVIRATVMVCLYAGARLFFRQPALSNCLALSAAVILMWNPTDLFNTGTQLSFLAVLGIVWACGRYSKPAPDDGPAVTATTSPLWASVRTGSNYIGRRIWDDWNITVAAALFTVWGLRTPNSDSLRCTFLSVGHGGAILIECPNGGTLLYDAGAMQDGRIAQRAVQQTLWERRRHGLDALIVSHADMDHFNGAADLMQSLPVGSLLVSQQFLDFKQPAVPALGEATAASGVPIRLVRDGDQLRLDDRIQIRVLHPPFGRPHSDDNANSIVLAIEFAGRRILLTGDLEGHGQATLLRSPPLPVDVLLSPHHGSRRANSGELAVWARPKELVVSADSRVDFKALRAAYDPETRITSTDDAGAVTFEIHPDGRIERTTYVRETHVR
jgi:ComEC/Rec2-related protein